MSALCLPDAEGLRLQGSSSFSDIVAIAQEQELKHFLELAAFACNCPLAVISFEAGEKHWLRANRSLQIPIGPKNLSFCSYVMLQDDIMIVQDARNDKRFGPVQKINDAPGILFYAGAPIINADGHRTGSLCVMDTSAEKEFTDQQKNTLKTIAQLAACLFDLKLNNRLAIQNAVDAEKRITHLTISEQDSEKGFIAHKLQENFAQTLAATKLYLELAEQSQDKKDHFIQKSRDNISAVIDEIRDLCKSMVPATLGNPDMAELLGDMITEWETNNNISVDFVCGTSLQGIRNRTGLTLFHIIQQQLKLAAVCSARKAEISITERIPVAPPVPGQEPLAGPGREIILCFSARDIDFAGQDPQNELFLQNITARVAMVNGDIIVDTNGPAGPVMRINIPQAFIQPQAGQEAQ